MREEEFKEWLIARGVSLKSISTRTHAVRTIERNLEQLGFDQPDLDTIIQDDDFDQLRERLSTLSRDAQNGGEDFRILMPQSDNPEKRLASWKSWLGQYEQFADANAHAPETDYAELYAVWDDFLEHWPIDRLRTMQLSEYTKAGEQSTFSYWIEARLDKMGSIWGGSAFKFGVYSRKDTDERDNSSGRSYSEKYGWYTRLGNSAEEAFENVRAAIVSICEAAISGNLATIQKEARLGLSIKWKIAFHYQDRDNPTIVNVFKKKSIQKFLGDHENKSLDVLHTMLIANKPEEQGILEYGATVWSEIVGQQKGRVEVIDQTKEDDKESLATNLILYGPPGTGKTYSTAEEAVRLCDGAANFPETKEGREALMDRYRELVSKERIAFVTFHQNFSYEEFVEGLRPSQTDEDGNQLEVGFRLAPELGIFSKIAERAEVLPASVSNGYDLVGKRFFKMSLGEVANPEDDYLYEEAIENGYLLLGGDSGMDWSDPRLADKAAMIDGYSHRHPNDDPPGKLAGVIEFPYQMRTRMRIGDLVVISKGNLAFRAIGEITGEFRQVTRDDDYTMHRTVRWLWRDDDGLSYDLINTKRFSQRTIYEFAASQLKLEALQDILNGQEAGNVTKAEQQKQFVLIIDEINRANISKVFGELITLIEPDKRLGMPNALKVRLPYSKKEFGVPANLHIIGTMNTADRSIALLDTALRRRFRFKELAPDTSVPAFQKAQTDAGIPLAALLESMNRRIEYLIDRDHRIGHAFFIGCKTKEDVDAKMRDNVIPLLQEYFFDDWNRLAAVLGEGEIGGNFLECEMIEDPMGDGGEPLKSWQVRKSFEREAYDRVIGKAKGSIPTTTAEHIEPETGGK